MADLLLKFAEGVTVNKDGVITAILSTEAVDRDGDVVRVAGWDLDNFQRAPRLMSCHDYGSLTKQIGEWRNVRVDPARKALVGEPHYYTGKGNPEADWAYYLASIGQATYSVGFTPAESEPRKGGGHEYTAQELLECSHVPIPANQEALQLMAKAFQLRQRQPRAPGRTVQKWDSAYMDGDGGYGAPAEQRCGVPGCDDACQFYAPVCSEHMKVLMNAPAEPPGSPPDDLDDIQRAIDVWLSKHRRTVKAGRTISAANMNHLHTALDSMHAVHDGACKDDTCAYNDAGDGGPPQDRDKQAKAASEGDGSAGGVTVSDSGTHGAFTGKHGHKHDAAGHSSSADSDGNHDHSHGHDGDGNHGHSHDGVNFKTAREIADAIAKSHSELPDSAFACIDPGGEVKDGKTHPLSLRHYPHHTASGGVDKGLLRSALSRLGDESNEQCGKAHLQDHAKEAGIGDRDKAFDLDAALDKILEGVEL